ncbi:MAG TPA: hypothetical protein VJ781_08465, partial [Pyrinomonadaceae bacterium]|nr:hypothetical protein [Pyrinomonadaceae bacterium]
MKETRVVTTYLTGLIRAVLSSAIVCVLMFNFGSSFASAQACSATAPQVIQDGGFEIGPVPDWPLWPIQSSLFLGAGETPICHTSICQPAAGPARSGDSWLLFGFNAGVEELAQVGQTINVASTSVATLRFWMRFSQVDAPDLDDVVNI